MRRISHFTFIAATALLAACSGGSEGRFDVILVGDKDEALAGTPPLTDAAALLREATGRGLVTLDIEGRIRPDLAVRWIVTDDGLSYIFRFENTAAPGEKPMTANDVRKALVAAISSVEGTGLSRDLDVIDGIYARTNQVIEIQLKTAMPEFLQLLAAPELALSFKGQDTGALSLDVKDSLITLSRLGSEAPSDSLDVRIASPKEAVLRFQRGEAELLLGGNLDALPHVEMGGLLRGSIRLDPVSGVFGLAIAEREGFLSQASNREALSMAIDRQALISPFKIGGWTARSRLVPVGLPGTEQPPGRWSALTMEQRQSIAAQRVAGWLASEGPVAPLTIAVPSGSGGDILFRRLTTDLARIGLGTRRVTMDAEADLRLVDEVAMLDRPEWYLHRFDCTVIRALCSPEADALVAEAVAESDPGRRAELLTQAEALLTGLDAFVSFGPPIRFSLVRGGVDGFAVNRWGFHPLSGLFADPT